MKNNRFIKTQIATSLSIALGAFSAPMVYAADDAEVEVIEVKGIRGSLVKSQDIKRSSSGVVDAISAEDIGKFPDTNLAESLQRITGVSIDRQSGEGSKVTVRGFGPDYNLVTLNGRQMPSSSINATSASDSRSFDFGNLASEGISAIEVYKTGRAAIPTGGIGSTINLVTIKPLDNPGQKASFGVKAVHDTSSQDGDALTPELSGLYSNTFADDTIGIAISASYQNRQSGSARAGIDNGWRPQIAGSPDDGGTDGGWGALPADTASHVNQPVDGTVYSLPQNAVYGFKEEERTRTNGQLTLQYRPVDNLTATLDYTYAENEVDVNQNLHSVWMNFGSTSSLWTDPDSNGIAAPLVITENNTGVASDAENLPFGHALGDLTHADLVSQVEKSGTISENNSIGINLEYKLNDNLSFEFDYHSSSAESKPNSSLGNSNTIQMATNIRGATSIDFTSDFPVVSVDFPSDINASDFSSVDFPNPNHTLSNVDGLVPDTVRTTGTSFRNSYMKSEIDQLQLNGRYVFDDGIVESIDFGISRNEVSNRNAFGIAERATWGGVGQFGDVPAELLLGSQSTMADRFDNLPGDKSNMINSFWDVDFDDIAKIVGELYGDPSDPATWPCGNELCAPSTYTEDRRTTEDSTSFYVQADLAFEVLDMPVDIIAGIRYEETEVTANTLLPDIEKIGWISDNEFSIVRGEEVFYEGVGEYDYLLPSIDASIEVIDDVIIRASYGETITRPGYGNLTAGGSLNEVRIDKATGSSGNPGLLPIESTNIDLSFEWYYDEGSYLSVGYFKKDVDNFISNDITTSSPFNVTSPVSGAIFDEAVAALPAADQNNSALIRAKIIELNGTDGEYIIGANTATGAGAQIWGGPGNDIVEVEFSQPVNADSNSVDGFELALQHIIGDTGFGFIANFTVVDSDLEYDNADLSGASQTPLIGLSDSANLVAFYDDHGWQARIAYNWRDTFLSSTQDGVGANPIYVEAYSQIDLNVSYDYSEQLTMFAEVINLTDEYTRSFGRHEKMTVNIEQFGPRYNIGARYSF